jgi:hypothetical protein
MSSLIRSSLTLLAAVPAAVLAQQPRALPAPEATFEEPFSQVTGLRELSNGRVLVADARDKTFQLLDLSAGTASAIGREGNGPGEYALPFRVLPARGDTTFLFDMGNQRYLVIAPDGKPNGEFRQEEEAPPPSRPDAAGGRQVGQPAGPAIRIGVSFPRTSDGMGRIYFEGPAFGPGPDGRPVPTDSVALLRYDRAAKRTDTLTYIRVPKPISNISGSQGNVRVSMQPPNPLLPRDEWAVFPDGRVAVVRSPEYRVDWVMPNLSRVAGRPIAFTPIRMTDADKREEEALRQRARQNAMAISVSSGNAGTQRSVQMGPGANAPPLEPLTDWPATKPPFRSGQPSVWARPNGELWVRRTEPAGAKGTLYDVINAQGAVTHQVRIGDGLNLVGFGNGTVYTTKADEDDLLYLQRHRIG